MAIAQGQQIDANYRTVTSNEAFLLSSAWTFVENATGDTGAHTLFTVTGDVLLSVFAVCSTNLAGSATIEVGVTGNTAGILAQIADATTLDAGEVWVDDTATIGVKAIPTTKLVTNGLDVLLTIGSADLTAGVVTFYCLWRPLSSDGNVTVTTPS